MIYYLIIPVEKLLIDSKRMEPKSYNSEHLCHISATCKVKLLFTSIKLLFAVKAYNSDGEVVPDSTVLHYDPSIRFFQSEHIPYCV